MKKIIPIVIFLTALFQTGYSQLFTFTFNGTGTCPTQGSSLSPQPPNVTVGSVTRYGTLTCSALDNFFNTTSWTTNSSIDNTQYIEFTVTAAAGYVLNLTSLNFVTQRSSTGPVNGSIYHDGGTGTFSDNFSFTNGTSAANQNWDFTDFSTGVGGTVKFRIYGWSATGSSGNMRLDDIALNATVTPNSPLSIDYINGRAGVGVTTALAERFEVNGNIKTTGLILNTNAGLNKVLTSDAVGNATWQNASGATSGWSLSGNTGTNSSSDFIGTTDAKPLIFRTSNTEYMRMDENGHVGIGTINTNDPTYNLFVEKGIRTRKVKVDALTWSDYVFESDYHLPTLSEVEKYVQENKHLPGVPSASEVKSDGIDVASSQAVLLQKIEELTLYIIGQNKRIEGLEKKNTDLLQIQGQVEELKKLVLAKQH